jgi:cell division protein FtsI (penicillin-binding protein 3)
MPASTSDPKLRRAQIRARDRLTPPKPVAKHWGRFVLVWLLLIVGQVGLLARLIWLQIYDAPHLQQTAKRQQSVQLNPQLALRPIVDRNGAVLAKDESSFRLFAHPFLFSADKQEVATKLAPLLGQTPDALVKLFDTAESGIPIQRDLDASTATQIRDLRLDGLELNLEWQRVYPHRDLTAGVVGYVNAEHQGQSGIEYSQDPMLEVRPPAQWVAEDARGLLLPEQFPLKPLATDNLALKLTIDTRVQWAARTALKQKMTEFKAKRGTVIVMDVKDGSLLGLVSEPSFDPEKYYEAKSPSQFKNWAVSDLYEPGSTFKPINVAIALDLKAIQPDTVVYDEGNIVVGGWPIQNNDGVGRGPLTITQVMEYSSNVGMVHIMERLKPLEFYDFLRRLGLGEVTGSDLPFETPGQIKDRKQFDEYIIEPATTSFGQGFSVTPLQMVQLHAAIANGGKLVTPHLVQGLYDPEGRQIVAPNLMSPRQVFTPETAEQVRKMMGSVVENGTGQASKIPGYRLGGKTGTAQKALNGTYTNERITSFVSFFPLEQPRYLVFAVVDEPQGANAYGGTVSAPIVKSVLENLITIEEIPPSHPQEITAETLKTLKAKKTPPGNHQGANNSGTTTPSPVAPPPVRRD